MVRLLLLALVILFSRGAAAAENTPPIHVFAAASTQNAVEKILSRCPSEANVECRGVYAASSTLARQIVNGAPADIFISANVKWMDYVRDKDGLVPASRTIIATNRLALVVPRDAPPPLSVQGDLPALLNWAANGRIAIGDPTHVPAGIYAREALTSLDRWNALVPNVVALPNVRAALALIARAEVRAGIVYVSDARITDLVRIATVFPGESHAPIAYPMAIMRGANANAAHAIAALFTDAAANRIFAENGFGPAE